MVSEKTTRPKNTVKKPAGIPLLGAFMALVILLGVITLAESRSILPVTYAQSVADLKANAGPDQTVLIGQNVTFNGTNSTATNSTIISYLWNFGDNATGSGAIVFHFYNKTGVFNATLLVVDNRGANASDKAVITVLSPPSNLPPIADAGPDQTVFVGSPVTFNGSKSKDPDGFIATYKWNFGDGSMSFEPVVTHSYSIIGTFNATITVTDNGNATGTDTTKVTVQSQPTPQNQPPIAKAGPDQTGVVGQKLTFDGSNSTDLDGTIVSFRWDFGDGSSSSGRIVSHSYSSVGKFTVTLTVTDNKNATGTDTATVTINTAPSASNQPPVSNAGPDRTMKVGQSILFNGSASFDPDGSIIAYLWNFGDGQTANGRIAAHTYSTQGTFNVTLTVIDNDGAKGSDIAVITVTAPGGAGTTPSPQIPSDKIDEAIEKIQEMIKDIQEKTGDKIDSQGIANSLISKLENAEKAFQDGNIEAGMNILGAFINEVEAQRGKHIDKSFAENLIEKARDTIDDLREAAQKVHEKEDDDDEDNGHRGKDKEKDKGEKGRKD